MTATKFLEEKGLINSDNLFDDCDLTWDMVITLMNEFSVIQNSEKREAGDGHDEFS